MAGLFALGGMQTQAVGQPQPVDPNDPYAPNPFEQQLQGMAQGMFSLGQQHIAQPFNYNNAPALPGTGDFLGEKLRMEQGMYNKAREELNNVYRDSDFEMQMANQGIDSGTPAYARAKEQYEKAKHGAYNDAAFKSMLAGGQEQSRLFDMGLKSRQQYVTEANSLRDQPIKEMAALLNPAAAFAGMYSQERTARRGQDIQRYGIDTERDTARRGQDIQRYGIDTERDTALRAQDIQRYGIDREYETAGLDRTSRETIARERNALDEDLADKRMALDRELSENRISFDRWVTETNNNLQREIATSNQNAQKALQDGRISADQALAQFEANAAKELQSLNQQWTQAQNRQDRELSVRIEKMRAQAQERMARISAARSGGGAAPDWGALLGLLDQLGQGSEE